VEELELVWVCCEWRTPPTAVTVWQIPDAVDTVVCAPDDGWKCHPKHVEQFPDINKRCNVASCWIYVGILLAHPILHISRIRGSCALIAKRISSEDPHGSMMVKRCTLSLWKHD
jgi:hypothetical protein